MHSRYKHYYDRSVNEKFITIGSRVYCKNAKIPVGRSRALTKGYFGPLRVLDIGDIGVKCVLVSKPNANPQWIDKKRLKLVTTDHIPSYEESAVAHWEQLREIQAEATRNAKG